jgi:membrane-associated protease RseP (regulator of RpoE activity)
MTSQPTIDESSAFARFMASGYGRLIRLGLGIALIAVGLILVPRPAGLAIAVFGLVPITSGAFNLCPVAPLWGGHFFGSQYCALKRATGSD